MDTFRNKGKNHLVVLSPNCLETCGSVEELESLLHLRAALSGTSAVGCMRDSDALKLFSVPDALKCLDANQINEFMDLMPWALQEEVFRNPQLSREERLMKAILSLKLLLHDFDLSSLPRPEGVRSRLITGDPA
jgi:hypothetical protein